MQYTKDLPSQKVPKLKLRRTLKGHLSKVYSVEWNANSRCIVSASQDGKLLVWDALTGNKLEVISLRSSWVMTCAYSPSGTFVACGGLDNTCYIYNLKGKEPTRAIRELLGHQGFIGCCRFIDDKKMVTCSGDHTCALWDVETGQLNCEFKDHKGEVMTLSLSPIDNNLFISGGSDSFVKLWDTRTPSKPAQSFKAHSKDVNGVCFFPSGFGFGTASDDCSAKLFDIRANAELMQYSAQDIQCPISSVTFSKSGHYLFSGQEDHNVTAWDTLKGERVYTLNAHQNRVSCVSVAPDGMALCTASWDNELRIWA